MRYFSLFLITLCFSTLCCTKKERPRALKPQPPITLPSGVIIQTLMEGDGDVAKKGDKIIVHFVGKLDDGSIFDSSRERDQPFSFWVGEGQVITGWDEGLLGAHEGEIRQITVPPSAGYGSDRKPKIPPNSTLHFEIELIHVR